MTVKFKQVETFDEVDLHTDPASGNYVIASAKIWVDKNSDGKFATSELVQTVTGNSNAVLIAGFGSVTGLAVQVSNIVTKGASTYASIAEFEVYLRDIDFDGLSNGFEISQMYSQDAAAESLAGSPLPIGDDNVTTTAVKLEQWAGIVKGGYANFTVTHERTEDLAVSVGYWDGGAWKDRYVWSPAGKAPLAEIKLAPTGYITGNVAFNASSTNGVSLKEVRFYRDGTLMLTDADASDPWFHWTWNTIGFAQTTYNIELVAIDTSGNAVSKIYPVIVDNSAPTATITAPTSGQSLTGATNVKVTASDNGGIAKVSFYVDSGPIPNATVTSPSSGQYQWTWDTSLDSDGSHTVKAVVYDLAGLTTVKTVGVTVNNGGGTPIRVRISNPQPLALVPSSMYVQGTTGLDASRFCQDIRAFVDGALAGLEQCLGGVGGDQFSIWTYSGGLTPGYHFLAVKVTDMSGKTGGTTIPVSVDPVPPTASIVSPANGAFLHGRVTIKVAATDNMGIKSVGLRITNGGISMPAFPSLTQPGADGYFSWTWDTPIFPYLYDAYAIEATATDLANAAATSTIQVTVDNDAPTGYFQTPTPGATVSGSTSVTVYASDNAPLGGATGGRGSASGLDRVEFLVDSSLKFTDSVEPYTWTWDTAQVLNALHFLGARAYDRAGNLATFSIQVTVSNGGPASQPTMLTPAQAGSQSTLIAGKKAIDGATAASAYEALNYDGTPLTYNQVGTEPAAPPGVGNVSGKTTVVIDLLKYIRDLTASEKSAGILAPNYTSGSLLSDLRWRIQVFDLNPGATGVLNDFRITLIATTDPAKADTDGDGLKDGQEMLSTGHLKSLPVARDTDNDGLSDGDEVNVYHSSPLLKDTDADGLGDYDEAVQYVPLGTSPFMATVQPSGSTSRVFEAPVAGSYMVKFQATTTLLRDGTFLGVHTLDDIAFIESSNDDLFRGLLTMKVDGVIATRDTRGNLTAASYSGTRVNMTETRYFFVWDQSLQYSAGTHTLLLQLGAYSDSLIVRISAIEVNKKGLAITNPDADGDGLKDGEEVRLGTNPLKVDTDGDGLWDGADGTGFGETSLGTDPRKADTDGDGVWDGYTTGNALGELSQGTNPLVPDTDGDGLWDGYDLPGHLGELSHGTLPLNPDTDSDTMWDGWEIAYSLSPVSNDASLDPDADGLTNGQEFTAETNPRVRDSDLDNLTDGAEASPVLLRTNIELGANTSAHYAKLLDWVAYRGSQDTTGYRYMFGGTYTNQSAATSPANSRWLSNLRVTILSDGSYVLYNSSLLELYVWVPSADHGDLDHNGTGDGVLEGSYYRFVRSAATESLNAPLPGYRGKEIYAMSDPAIRDTDYDGIPDGDEIRRTLDSDGDGLINCLDPDSDNDGVVDGQEVLWWSDSDLDGLANMIDPDSDNDGIRDGTEMLWNVDTDLDGLPSMIDVDSDGDGLPDGTEDANHDGITQPSETSPILQDTDLDGLLDSVELNPYGDADADGYVNANDADSDSDGLPDGNETNPFADTDGDGMVNVYDSDSDDDGLADGAEVAIGSDPLRPDTDGDQLIDGPDITVLTTSSTYNWFLSWGLPTGSVAGHWATFFGEQAVGASPIVRDTDSDGLEDGTERVRYGTNPASADTDGDGLPDSSEANPDVYWYEAEDYGTPADNPDLATIATVPFMVPVPGNYRLYASAMGAACDYTLSLRIMRTDMSPVYSESVTMSCSGTTPDLRWYSIRSTALAAGQTYLLQARDDGAGHVVYVDKIMTIRLEDLRVTTITPPSFTLSANTAQSAQIQINTVPGVPLYVTQATMTLTGGPAMGEVGLSNGGFESDFTDWTSAGAIIDSSNVHSGAKSADVYAYIDPYGGDVYSSSLTRSVGVPSGSSRAAIRYYVMKAASSGCSLSVSPVPILLTSGTWSYYEINVTAWAGSSVTLTFSASCGSSRLPRAADYYIDDVTLMVANQYPVSPRLNVAATFDPGDPQWIYINPATGDTLRTSVTTWDLSGDINRYMFDQLNRNPALTTVTIPFQVAATTAGVITFSNVNIALGPRVSDPTDSDTDSDRLPDGVEYRVNTSSLMWDSDHDAVVVGGGTMTWTHTPVASPSLVTVSCMGHGPNGVYPTVTYGGVSMASAVRDNGVSGLTVAAYFLNAPPSGAQPVAVTLGRTWTGGRLVCSATSWTGTNGVDTFSATWGANGGGASTSQALIAGPAGGVSPNNIFFSVLARYAPASGSQTDTVAGMGALASIVDNNVNQGTGTGFGCFLPGNGWADCIATAQLLGNGYQITWSWSPPGYDDAIGFGILAAGSSSIRVDASSDSTAAIGGSTTSIFGDYYEVTTVYTTTPGCIVGSLTRTNPADIDTDGDGKLDGVDECPVNADTDNDGLRDSFERWIGTLYNDPDTDRDGLLDGEEYYGTNGYRTDPLNPDTDGDGLWDGWQDSNHNLLYDSGEPKGELGYRVAGTGKWGTNPLSKDTDADGIPDGVEATYGLNPTNAADANQDLDHDGLTNLAEYKLSVQNGNKFDLDMDGVPNFSDPDDDGDLILTIDEIAYGLNPYLASDAAGDLDGDGLTNQFEYTYDQNPASGGVKLDLSDPDTDGDGLTDGQEISLGTNPLSEDTDRDTLSDGDEVAGWYIYILVDDTPIERHVTSDPTLQNSDADRLNDSQEYLRTDPRNPDTDGDGLWDDSPYEDDPLEPESIPPKLGTPSQVTVLEWGWLGFIPVVVHTWLTVAVEATDNAAVANVTFRLIDTNTVVVRTTPEPNSVYKATFEIDFWNDYVLGYQVELKAFDRAGNVMGTQIGGGLEYIIEGLVASFLSFFLGPELAGGVIGFFVGFATGLFEDLTIFLHIGEMWDAIQQLPKLIGQIVGNPSILLEMVTGMITGVLAKGNMINPYGRSSMTAGDFGNLLVKFFWHIFDPSVIVPTLPNPKSDLFNLAFTVSHLIGYFVQQFIVGTGLTKVAGKLKHATEITAVGKRLSEAAQVVKSVASKVREIATSVARGLGRGVSSVTSSILEKLGFKLSERATAGTGRLVGKLGPEADDVLEQLGKRGDDVVEDLFFKLDEASPQVQRKIQRLIDRLEKDPKGASGELKYLSENFDEVQDLSLYLRVEGVGVIKPDFLLKDGTLVEIKNWDKALFESPFMKQKLAEQLRRYSKFTGGNGLVKLKLVGEYDAAFLRNLKSDLVDLMGGTGSWLDISCFR